MSDQKKRKINRNNDKIQELVNQEHGKRRGGCAFLAPLLTPTLGSLVGPLLNGITGREMAEEKKYVVFAPEMYQMLLIKAETPVNPIASTIKQIQENLSTVCNGIGISEKEKIAHKRVKQVKKGQR